MIVVFPNKKLVSIDSILPVLLELKIQYQTNSKTVFFDKKTYMQVHNNVVLRDVLIYVGGFTYINKRMPLSLLKLLYIYIIGFLKVKYIHFGVLSDGILFKLWKVHSKNVFFSQSDSYRHNHLYYRKKLNGKDYISNIKSFYGNLIAFNDLMPQLSIVSDSTRVFHFGESRTRSEWINFTRKKSEFYFNKYHANLRFNDNFIVFILGPMCEVIWLKNKDSYEKLFRETMKILRDSFSNTKVLLKPHATTNLDIVNSELEKKGQFELTYLHPSVLAHHANCFICNLYSTTMADAYNLGAKTIEYTDYNEKLLSHTNDKSVSYQYIDYFVNRDQSRLVHALEESLRKKRKNCKINQNKSQDTSGLLKELSN